MFENTRKYIPSIVTAVLGILILLIIPSQIDLSRVRGTNMTGIDARTIPYFLTFAIIGLSLLELFLAKKRESSKDTAKTVEIQHMNFIRVLLTLIAIILWVVLVPYLGFIFATTILLVAVMLLMGNKKWTQIMLVPILTSFILSYVFTVFVGRTLPTGIFFN